jgi:hypothetical protein
MLHLEVVVLALAEVVAMVVVVVAAVILVVAMAARKTTSTAPTTQALTTICSVNYVDEKDMLSRSASSILIAPSPVKRSLLLRLPRLMVLIPTSMRTLVQQIT